MHRAPVHLHTPEAVWHSVRSTVIAWCQHGCVYAGVPRACLCSACMPVFCARPVRAHVDQPRCWAVSTCPRARVRLCSSIRTRCCARVCVAQQQRLCMCCTVPTCTTTEWWSKNVVPCCIALYYGCALAVGSPTIPTRAHERVHTHCRYVVAFAYVFADTADKSYAAYKAKLGGTEIAR